jgi:uncharacterized membrane protein (TIGR02234 family)
MSSKAAAVLLLAAGGGVTLLGATAPWAELRADDGLVGASATVSGSALAPLSVAAGAVGLAAVVAVLAVRGWLRGLVAVVVVLLSALALAQVVGVLVDSADVARRWWAVEVAALAESAVVQPSVWAGVTAAGLVLLLVAGIVVLARGGSWAGLSSRYDAPGAAPGGGPAARSVGETDTWQALDRGEDPTAPEDAGA